jgi:hypothetical protein
MADGKWQMADGTAQVLPPDQGRLHVVQRLLRE